MGEYVMKKLFNMDAKKRNIIVASILGVTIGGLSMFGLNHKKDRKSVV